MPQALCLFDIHFRPFKIAVKDRLRKISEFLESGLIDRQIPARLSLLAALSGEHFLILGKPGTAKSELARKLHQAFAQSGYFERLLTKFTVPEELFGPLSIKALEQDQYLRLTRGYLPQASIAFIDEIFKANSAILNALLTLLNEREFDNGSERVKVPLICVVAASNELAEDDTLQALYDRFLLRYQVHPVADEQFDALLDLSTVGFGDYEKLTPDDICQIQQMAEHIKLSEPARVLIHSLRQFLQQQSIYVSDRRWRKLLKLLQVAACTNGQEIISEWDCALLLHCVWDQPEQYAPLQQWFGSCLHADYQQICLRYEKLLAVIEQKTRADADKRTHRINNQGEKLYLTPEGEQTTQAEYVVVMQRNGEAVYKAPPVVKDRDNNGLGYTLAELSEKFFDDHYRQTHIQGQWVDLQQYVSNTQNRMSDHVVHEPVTDPFLFAPDYKNQCHQDVLAIMQELQRHEMEYQEKYSAVQKQLDDHLWLSQDLAQEILHPIDLALKQLAGCRIRLQTVLVMIEQLHTTGTDPAPGNAGI